MKCCKRCIVKGRVQGVFYRQGTLKEAKKLGVTGWVHNLYDGTVECLLCGEEEAVNKLCHWLQKGPVAASVKSVTISDAPWEELPSFEIIR